LAVTLLNIHESARFKKGAFRFWGCLPVYSAEAAGNAGTSESKIRIRAAEVHQAGLGIVLEAVRELNSPAAYRFANGQVLMGEGLLDGRSACARQAYRQEIKIMQDVFMPLRRASQHGGNVSFI
jgi:hypothetical protein